MLKVLMLRKKLDTQKKNLEKLRKKESDFEKRTKELEVAISELRDDSTEEEQQAVEDEVAKLEEEKQEYEDEKKELEETIADIEKEIEEAESQQPTDDPKQEENRGGQQKMTVRNKFFNMPIEERDRFFKDENVEKFLSNVRTCIKEHRAIENVGLTIPQVMLPLIRQTVEENSKLISKVNLQSVSGTSRQNIMGDIPEGIWTEMCGSLNEMDLKFNNIEMDGYAVAGFFAVCNAVLEDSDEDLATEIINAIGKAIGKALDKSVLFGHGVKMPLGIVTRLAQEVRPNDYPSTARAWKDLHVTNILKGSANLTGKELFKDIIKKSTCVINDYSSAGLTWVMNEKTHKLLMAESLDADMNGAIVAGMQNTMPIVGGEIVELNFIADNNIIFGHFDLYTLGERAGAKIDQSEHVKFLDNQTVFRGVARYDGKPAIDEGFGVMTIDGKAPVTSATFRADDANDATLTSLTLGSETLAFNSNTYEYEVSATASNAVVNAVPAQEGASVTIMYGGKKYNNGQELTLEGSKNLVVTVKNGMSKLIYTVKVTKG